jgi:hypothetical protein
MIRLLTEALPILSLGVLAQANSSGLPDPNSPAAIGWLLAGAFALVGMANQGMELWRKVSPVKTPPDHEVYATKKEVEAALTKAKEEAAKEFSAHKAEIARVESDHRQTLQRIESRFEDWITEFDKETRAELDKLTAISRETQSQRSDLERALGRLEGMITGGKAGGK